MPSQTQISRETPSAFLFLVDQSASMGYVMPSVGKPKAKHVADVLNRTILNLIDLCNKADGIRDYFHIGVICYGGLGVNNGLSDDPTRPILNPVSYVAENTKYIETIIQKVDNGLGKFVERESQFPVWIESEANGETPMCAAFEEAKKAIAQWCLNFKGSYPPIVINITDGDSTDGNPENIVSSIKHIGTIYGDTLVFNIHVSSSSANVIKYPQTDKTITDDYAKMLFRMSSKFPEYLAKRAAQRGYNISTNSSGFVFNADAADIVNFLEIGTLPASQSSRR